MTDVAVDNSVISKYIEDKLNPDETADKNAFKEMISLHRQGIIELGGPNTTLMLENLMKSGESRRKMLEEIGKILKYWSVLDNDPQKTDSQTKCLHNIIQDKNGHDSRQLVIISRLTQARYFVTMDYRFHRQFNARKQDIIRECGMNIFVMRPTEFIEKYAADEIL